MKVIPFLFLFLIVALMLKPSPLLGASLPNVLICKPNSTHMCIDGKCSEGEQSKDLRTIVNLSKNKLTRCIKSECKDSEIQITKGGNPAITTITATAYILKLFDPKEMSAEDLKNAFPFKTYRKNKISYLEVAPHATLVFIYYGHCD